MSQNLCNCCLSLQCLWNHKKKSSNFPETFSCVCACQGLTYFFRDRIVDILNFVGHMASFTTIQLNHWKPVIDNTLIKEHGCFNNALFMNIEI